MERRGEYEAGGWYVPALALPAGVSRFQAQRVWEGWCAGSQVRHLRAAYGFDGATCHRILLAVLASLTAVRPSINSLERCAWCGEPTCQEWGRKWGLAGETLCCPCAAIFWVEWS